MDKHQINRLSWTTKLGAFSVSLLWGCGPAAAHGNGDAMAANLHRLHHGGARGGVQNQRLESIRNAANNAVRLPGHISEFRINRPIDNHVRTFYLNDNGNARNVRNGVELDFASANANITLGSKAFGDTTVSIEVGGELKSFAAGSTVTAAEYAALTQKLTTGEQGLTLNANGVAIGGSLDVNSVNDRGRSIRAAELVVPTGVVVNGDWSRTADGIRLTGDLVNHGSIIATSGHNGTAFISARDINNEQTGSISTENGINLSLTAARSLNNAGQIISSGELLINAPTVNNHGTIGSNNNNVTFIAAHDVDMNINNVGGTISALSGAINIREADFSGTGNSTVTGGDLLSQTMNIHAGQGTGNVFVQELTGALTSEGSAVHVGANTDTLVIGQQCLTGDPTYYNTGDIVIGGNIIVAEDLSIVAGGNITTNQASLQINANSGTQSCDIFIVAGANVTDVGTQASTIPTPGPVSTSAITFSGASTTGGNIDLQFANSLLDINSAGAGSGIAGGDITLAAFAGTGGGSVLLPTNSSISANGLNLGTPGAVTIIAGGASGTTLQVGTINNISTSGTNKLTIATAQPTTSDGSPIVVGTKGNITSGNTLVPSAFKGGDVITSNLTIQGDISVVGNGSVSVANVSGNNITLRSVGSTLTAGGNVFTSTGKVTLETTNKQAQFIGKIQGVNISIKLADSNPATTGGDLLMNNTGTITAFGDGLGNGGSISIVADSYSVLGGVLNLNAPSGGGGNGGSASVLLASNTDVILGGAGSNLIIDVHGDVNGGAASVATLGNITLNAGGLTLTGANGNGGDLSLTAGLLTGTGDLILNDAAALNLNATGANSNGGKLQLLARTIQFASNAAKPLVLSANGKGTGSGGTVNYIALANPTTTVIGAPAVKIKSPADFIQINATGGSTGGGAGGTVDVEVFGNLIVDSAGLNVGPQTKGDGAKITLLGSALVVAGNLNATGIGIGSSDGALNLFSNSKTTFTVNSGKVPKNGVQGTLNAGKGVINIVESAGSISIANSAALTGDTMTLNAGVKSILFGKGTTVTAAKALTLAGTMKKPLTVSTPLLTAISKAGAVNVNDTFAGATTVNSGTSASNYTLLTNGPTTLNNITTTKGSISVTSSATNGGLLSVQNNSTLTANSGSLHLVNLDTTNGDIKIGQNSIVQTLTKGKEVVIAIGPAPKKGTNPVPPNKAPSGITVNPVGKGTAFFGPGGVTATTTAVVNVINQSVIFNALNGRTITLDSGSIVTADPPSRHVSSFYTASTAGNHGQTVFTNANGVDRNLRNGLAVNLASSTELITLGSNVFGDSAVTIEEGGQARTFTVGDKVTAAEYAALTQKLSSGDQGLTLNDDGIAIGGSLDVNTVNDNGRSIRAAELVVPTGVVVNGDWSRTADGIRLTGDLVNHGSIIATSGHNGTAFIDARDINNEQTGSISTENGINLSLTAARSLNNAGQIISSGELLINAPTVNNHGSIGSINSDVTFSASNDIELNINNAGGTVSAVNGAINIRELGYEGIGNSTVNGGDLLSQTLHINAGKGTGNVYVNRLTGDLVSVGNAVHVGADTDNLVIGTQCLTGDPTFYNTGDITIAGNIAVTEALSIIAGGDILSSKSTFTISASLLNVTGFDILLVAGANVSPTTSNQTTSPLPAAGQNTTAPIQFDSKSNTGGNIDFSNASIVVVDSSFSGAGTGNAGNITLAAFSDGFGNNGKILFPGASSILANGSATGTNGFVNIIAGGESGTSIQLDSITNNVGTGGGGGVSIFGLQPETSNGLPIVIGTDGSITSGNSLMPQDLSLVRSASVKVGNVSSSDNVFMLVGDLIVGKVKSAADITLIAGSGTMTTSDLTASATDGTVAVATIDKALTINGSITAHNFTAQLSYVSKPLPGGVLTLNSNILSVSEDSKGNGGSISIVAESVNAGPAPLRLKATGSNDGGGAEFVLISTTDLVLGGTGSNLEIDVQSTGGAGGGSVDVETNGSLTLNTGGINAAGGKGAASNFTLQAGFLNGLSNLILNDTKVLNADATGADFAGGTISLLGNQILFASDALNPLVLSANGTGSQSGGIVLFNSANTNQVVVGAPAVKTKGASFLTISAASGSSGGDGGQVSVQTGGSLFVDPAGLDVSPHKKGVGGKISLGANNSGSALVITGGLDVTGVGGGSDGSIALFANSTKTFTINSGKTPKNGVFGSLNAGKSGFIGVTNNSGSISVQNSAALSADATTLSAGKGISAGKGATITSLSSLNLFGTVKKMLTVDSATLTANAISGAMLINDIHAGATLLNNSHSEGNFTLMTNGPTTLGSISTSKGSISVTQSATSGGQLNVGNGKTLTANSGSLSLVNLDTTNGDILIGALATVETQQKGKQVVIAIGEAPKKGTNPVPPGSAPLGINVVPVGKGQAFFGPGGVATTGGASVNVVNQSVIFNNLSSNTATHKIVLDLGSTITADPPSRPMPSQSQLPVSIQIEPVPSNALVAPMMPDSVENVSNGADTSQLIVNALNVQSIANGLKPSQNAGLFTAIVNGENGDDSEVTPLMLSGGNGYFNSQSSDLTVDAGFHSGSDSCSLDVGTQRRIHRNMLFAPAQDMTVSTKHGDVKLKAGSVALVMSTNERTAVFNLDDRSRDSVVFVSGGRSISLTPGQHAHVSSASSQQFQDVNAIELVLYRGLKRVTMENGHQLFTSEFSIPSACVSVKPLRKLMMSKSKEELKLAARMNKTAAIIRTIRPDMGDFVQFFKPMKTAMR